MVVRYLPRRASQGLTGSRRIVDGLAVQWVRPRGQWAWLAVVGRVSR